MGDKSIPGIEITDACIGGGAPVERGDVVRIHFRLFLNRGDLIQDSRKEGEPHSIHLGQRHVIAGLEKGIIGMRVGGKRNLVVSPHLAYRDKGVPGIIPPNAVLKFEIDLIGAIRSQQTVQNT